MQRTNFPNVRGDLSHAGVRRLALAFGTELLVDSAGPAGSLRKTATDADCPTILLEAGEVWKIEPAVVEVGRRGIHNVLIDLGMAEGERIQPAFHAIVDKTTWLRADTGGLLEFHASPGQIVDKGQPLATCTDIFGRPRTSIESPEDAILMGMTTLPSVAPGSPICHLAIPREGIASIRRALDKGEEGLHDRVRDDLASSVTVSEPQD